MINLLKNQYQNHTSSDQFCTATQVVPISCLRCWSTSATFSRGFMLTFSHPGFATSCNHDPHFDLDFVSHLYLVKMSRVLDSQNFIIFCPFHFGFHHLSFPPNRSNRSTVFRQAKRDLYGVGGHFVGRRAGSGHHSLHGGFGHLRATRR